MGKVKRFSGQSNYFRGQCSVFPAIGSIADKEICRRLTESGFDGWTASVHAKGMLAGSRREGVGLPVVLLLFVPHHEVADKIDGIYGTWLGQGPRSI